MYGLVIQGPLLSKGRTGKTANVPFSQVTNDDIVNYDCIDNIKNLIKDYGEIFDYIVCVTWKDQPIDIIKRLESILLPEQILLIDDNTREIESKGNIISGNNKNRQFFSTLQGVKFLKKQGIKYIVKTRTDQYLDCNALINSTVKLTNEAEILIPFISTASSQSILNIPDLYFSGKTEAMLNLCECILFESEMFENIHKDIFFKWGLHHESSQFFHKFRIVYFKFFGRFGNNFFISKFVKASVNNNFIACSNEVLNSLIWRGEPYEANVDDFIFSNMDKKVLPSLSFYEFITKVFRKIFKI